MQHLPELQQFTRQEQKRLATAARRRARWTWKVWMSGLITVLPIVNAMMLARELSATMPMFLSAICLAVVASVVVVHLWELNIILLPEIRAIVHEPAKLKSALDDEGPPAESPADVIISLALVAVSVLGLLLYDFMRG